MAQTVLCECLAPLFNLIRFTSHLSTRGRGKSFHVGGLMCSQVARIRIRPQLWPPLILVTSSGTCLTILTYPTPALTTFAWILICRTISGIWLAEIQWQGASRIEPHRSDTLLRSQLPCRGCQHLKPKRSPYSRDATPFVLRGDVSSRGLRMRCGRVRTLDISNMGLPGLGICHIHKQALGGACTLPAAGASARWRSIRDRCGRSTSGTTRPDGRTR